MKITPRKIDLNQLPQAEADFFGLVRSNVDENDQVFADLTNFFASESDVVIYTDYYFSYWSWFVRLTWERVGIMESTSFADQVLARQVPAAIALGFDVWKELVWNLHFRNAFPDDMTAAFTLMKKRFLESEAIIGLYKGALVSVKDLIPEIKRLNGPQPDSLQSAETMSKIQACFTNYNNNSQLVNTFVKPELATDQFVGLVNFFLGVESDRIWYVVDSFVRDSVPPVEITIPEGVDVDESVLEPEPENVAEVQDRSIENPPAANYSEIKTMIEARFARDASGEFVNLDGVLALLDSLASDQGDDQIRELYYFDEGAGKFQWNQMLLTWYGSWTNHRHQKSGRHDRARSFVGIQKNARRDTSGRTKGSG